MPALPLLALAALAAHPAGAPARPAPRDTTPAVDGAPADSALRVTVGGFVDVYYAHDLGRPRTLDRAFTTTAARHAEFNVNLAHVELAARAPRLRGRLALQAGTSVQANYAGEPRVGALAGPELARHVQEAFVGYRLRPGLWVDAGVFFAPFGQENWISRDNPVYTRSLIADNSPYYASGVRLAWEATRTVQLQAQVLNGWQNVSETNQDKAVAFRVDWSPTPRVTLAYDTFLGNEQPDSARARLRQFHELALRVAPTDRLTLWATLDYGREPRAGATPDARGAGQASWRGGALLARWALAPRVALGGRVERYDDPEQVIVRTGSAAGLRASGASANVDVRLHPQATWRTEYRALRADAPLFPAGTGARRDGRVLVTALALTL